MCIANILSQLVVNTEETTDPTTNVKSTSTIMFQMDTKQGTWKMVLVRR